MGQMVTGLRIFVRFVEKLTGWTGRIVSLLALAMMLVLVQETVSRYVFGSPTVWSTEMVTFLYGYYIMLGGAYLLRQNAHVRMDLVHGRLSLRNKALLDATFSFLFFLFCGNILWIGAERALESVMVRELSTTAWGPPLYPIRVIVPIGAFLFLLQGLAMLIRNLSILFRKQDL